MCIYFIVYYVLHLALLVNFSYLILYSLLLEMYSIAIS